MSTATSSSTLTVSPETYGLLTDLYQLTMSACYAGEGIDQRPASFELFARRLPDGFGYLIAMGLAQAIDYLENLRFSAAQIEQLQQTGIFHHAPASFWQLLADARFTGDVWALPEGTAVFAHEPLLRIEAPLWQAQLVETYLLNTLNYQTLVATRAARMRDVAGAEAKILEFGTRRAFSPQAALWAARAAIAAGFDGTSNVLAALQLGRTPAGTMAHALVMAISALEGSEADAFEAFHRYFPNAPLLIDTYDTLAAAEHLAAQRAEGKAIGAGVRIDSGDLAVVSQQVRSRLPDLPIFVSGDLDEGEMLRLKQAGAAIDGYGIGTKLVSGRPVNGVYKLVEIDGIPVMKASRGKATYPGRKQIFRQVEVDYPPGPGQSQSQGQSPDQGQSQDLAQGPASPMRGGQFRGDRLGLVTDTPNPGEQPLLQRVMQQGQRLRPDDDLATITARTAQSVASLPASVRQIEQPSAFAVTISVDLDALTQATRQRLS